MKIERAVDVQHASRAQPFEELVAIGREQHFAQLGIHALLILALALADREQREIMIAEHDDRAVAECLDVAQHRERLPAAIDQIAAEPEPVLRRIELDLLDQADQLVMTALDVADRPGRHQCSVLGIDSTNAGMSASKCVPSSATIW